MISFQLSCRLHKFALNPRGSSPSSTEFHCRFSFPKKKHFPLISLRRQPISAAIVFSLFFFFSGPFFHFWKKSFHRISHASVVTKTLAPTATRRPSSICLSPIEAQILPPSGYKYISFLDTTSQNVYIDQLPILELIARKRTYQPRSCRRTIAASSTCHTLLLLLLHSHSPKKSVVLVGRLAPQVP